MILSIACFTYHADTNEYVWTHVSTKFSNNKIQILDINEKTMVSDVCCSGQGMENTAKFDNHLWYGNIQTNCVSSKFLPWEYEKIIFSPAK